VEFSTAFCDAPSAWRTRDPISIADTGGALPAARFGAGPTIALGDGELRMAYDLDGDIYWGSAPSIGVVELLDPAPALSPTFAHEALGIGDPELVFDGTGWHLFYTARDASGNGSIGHAVASTTDVAFTADTLPTLTGGPGVRSLDAPTVYMRDGLWVLIARATLDSGATELRAYYTSEVGTSWARIVDGALEATTRVEGAGTEITGPSLIVHNSGYQLYYGRRTGTRWAVEVIASDELLLWRAIGEALGPIDDDERFDARGGRAPDAISLTDRVELVYRGHDGVSFELGWAVRDAPSDTAPAF
ncbi:MAG: hypothetical protein WBG86_21835, partial [Polyangiales bacterium]